MNVQGKSHRIKKKPTQKFLSRTKMKELFLFFLRIKIYIYVYELHNRKETKTE
jgi:hypothetical protein